MNKHAKNIDFSIRHWASYPRRYPGLFRLMASDYIPKKGNWIRQAFESCNFSMILSGRGRFERAGAVHEVEAPCVITQWPGEHLEYGPEESWEEWYLVYDQNDFENFRRRGFTSPERPVWPICDPASVRLKLIEFSNLTRMHEPSVAADRIDRIAEQALLETLLPGDSGPHRSGKLLDLAQQIRRDPGFPWTIDEMARSLAYSVATFRRRWGEYMGVPPAAYVQAIRVSEACRLLADSELSVREIAGKTGFEDEFYFSRRFKIEVGLNPRAYRAVVRQRGSR